MRKGEVNSIYLRISMHLWGGDMIFLETLWLTIASIPWNATVQMNIQPSTNFCSGPEGNYSAKTLFNLSCSYVSWWTVMGCEFVPQSRNDRRQFLVLFLMLCFSQLCFPTPMVFLDNQWIIIGTDAKFSMNGFKALNNELRVFTMS